MTSLLLAACSWPRLARVAGRDWRFVAPAPGDAFEYPPLRALALSRREARRRGREGDLPRPPPPLRPAPLRQPELGARHGRARRPRTRQGRPVCRRQPQPPDRAGRPRRCRRPTAAPGACRSTWRWSKARSRTTERRSAVFRLGSTGLTLEPRGRRLPRRVRDARRPPPRRPAHRRRRQWPFHRPPGPPLDRPRRQRPVGPGRRAVPLLERPRRRGRPLSRSAPTSTAGA